MHLKKKKFERNSSLEHYYKTLIGKTKQQLRRSINLMLILLLMFKIIVSGVKTFYGQNSKRNNPACTAET